MTLPDSVQISEAIPGYPVYEVDNSWATARITLHGAHVLDWTPKGQEPVLYVSPQAEFEEGKAIRGGIPVCWPWFNKHATDPSKPAHGIARIQFWEVTSVQDTESGTQLTFELHSSTESLEIWPRPFQLKLTVVVGESLEVTLETTNTGDAPFVLGQALHTYFAVGDIESIQVHGLDGATYTDATRDWTRHEQQGAIEFHQEVNRIYYSEETMRLVDNRLNRTVIVEKEGSVTSVIWNPWIAHAAAMSDLPDEGYHDFVCLETTNAEDDVREVAPGAVQRLVTRLKME